MPSIANMLTAPPPSMAPVNALTAPPPQDDLPPSPPAITEPPRSNAGFEDRVSTRIPTAADLGYDPHERSDLSVSGAAMLPGGGRHEKAKKSLESAHRNTAETIRKYYGHIDPGKTDQDAHDAFVQHAHDNIVWLWNQVKNRPWVPQAVDWYKGANRLAKQMADEHGISHRQAAGVIASLSPQMDWDQNVALADRTLKIRGNKDLTVTPEMLGRMQQYVDARTPKTRGALEMHLHGGDHKAEGQIEPIREGQKMSDLKTKMQQAMFVRAYDEVHNPNKGYDVISPSGERSVAMTDKGLPATASWNNLSTIANALRVADSKDHLPTISRALGSMHKVRNFYNNIIAPDYGHDITADTHAINVGLLRPMSGFHAMVGEGLGGEGPSSNESGVSGLYGLHADAYRRAADTISGLEGRRFLPREVQSVTWEAIRNMFKKEHKKVDKTTYEPLHDVGKLARNAHFAHRFNFMPADMARQAIHDAAGGIRDPAWWRPATNAPVAQGA